MAIELVFPLKFETPLYGGEQDPDYVDTDPFEDYISAKGFSFERTTTNVIDLQDGEIAFTDTVNGTVKVSELGGINAAEHKALDQLVHNIAETCYTEINKTGILTDSVIVWTNSGKTQKIRETIMSYTGIFVNQVISKQYDSGGSLSETLTKSFSYDSNHNVTSVSAVLS